MYDYGKSPLRVAHHVLEMCSVGLSFSFNIMLLLIVRKHKQGILKSFSRVVEMNCVFDILMSVTVLTCEEAESRDGVFFFFSNSFLLDYVDIKYHHIFVYWFAFGLCVSLLYQPIPFFHRYMVICRERLLRWREIFAIIGLYLTVWITTWQEIAMVQADARYEELAPRINYSMWTDPSGEVPVFTSLPLDVPLGKLYLINCFLVFPINSTIPFIFFYFIYQATKRNRSYMSAKTARLNNRLNAALLSQTILPNVLGSAMVGFLMITTVMGINIKGLGTFGAMTVAFVPVINPILTLIIVPAYYRTILPKVIRISNSGSGNQPDSGAQQR